MVIAKEKCSRDAKEVTCKPPPLKMNQYLPGK